MLMLSCVTTTDVGTKTIALQLIVLAKALCGHYRPQGKHNHLVMIPTINKYLAGMGT